MINFSSNKNLAEERALNAEAVVQSRSLFLFTKFIIGTYKKWRVFYDQLFKDKYVYM